MRLFGRREELDPRARAAIPLGHGEQVLAWASDEATGGYVVATTYHLACIDAEGSLAWSRPWHEADTGTWQSDSERLVVTWVDGTAPSTWVVRQPSLLQQTLRERLQASVVLADEFRARNRRTVRVVIRADLATGALVEQVVPGRGVDVDDPGVAREAASRLARLRSEVGL